MAEKEENKEGSYVYMVCVCVCVGMCDEDEDCDLFAGLPLRIPDVVAYCAWV